MQFRKSGVYGVHPLLHGSINNLILNVFMPLFSVDVFFNNYYLLFLIIITYFQLLFINTSVIICYGKKKIKRVSAPSSCKYDLIYPKAHIASIGLCTFQSVSQACDSWKYIPKKTLTWGKGELPGMVVLHQSESRGGCYRRHVGHVLIKLLTLLLQDRRVTETLQRGGACFSLITHFISDVPGQYVP